MARTSWYFEGYIGSEARLSRIPINHFPFQIGRQEDLGFAVPSNSASRLHAEIIKLDDELFLTDYASTNGTYVNKNRLKSQEPLKVRHGDVVHFGDFEVRLIEVQEQEVINEFAQTMIAAPELSEKLPSGFHELSELIESRMAVTHFQPIVSAGDNTVHAYEILGRGKHSDLSESPGQLFTIAESYDLAVELSELFRDVGVTQGAEHNPEMRYFLNIHPYEHYDNRRMINQLVDLRNRYPTVPLVMEVHEESAPNIDDLKVLIEEIRSLNIDVAYDDFGSGQARLLELVEAPADYLKFDIAMVRGIDKAPDAKKNMVAALIEQARSVGTKTLAEGLERREEAEVCMELGFDYFQGYYFGKPKPEIP